MLLYDGFLYRFREALPERPVSPARCRIRCPVRGVRAWSGPGRAEVRLRLEFPRHWGLCAGSSGNFDRQGGRDLRATPRRVAT